MERWKLILDILKFCAIAVGSISGLIGTLTETKEKQSGNPTPWGKRIVILIVLSGVIALTSQSIEVYLKHQSDARDAKDRLEAATKTSTLLEKANQSVAGIQETRKQQDTLLQNLTENVEATDNLRKKAEEFGDQLKNQGASISQTVTGIGQTAKDLKSVLSGQRTTLTELYRQAHPLGEITVQLQIDYPIRSGNAEFESEWLSQIRASAASSNSRTLTIIGSLDPNPDQYPRAFTLFKRPQFAVLINRTPSTEFGGVYDLEFQSQVPQTSIQLDLDLNRSVIEQRIGALMNKQIDLQKIKSRIDLYGSEIVIRLPETAPPESRIVTCTLLLPLGPGSFEPISLQFSDSDRLYNPLHRSPPNIFYVKRLSEKELGPKPAFK